MDKLALNIDKFYTTTNNNNVSYEQTLKDLRKYTEKKFEIPNSAVDTLKANILYKPSIKNKDIQKQEQYFAQEATKEDKEEIVNILKETKKADDYYSNIIVSLIKTKGHIELVKLLLTVKEELENRTKTYSAHELTEILKKCNTNETTMIAYDVNSVVNKILDEEIYNDLLYFKNNEPNKYEYIKNSPSLLNYENNSASCLNKMKNFLKEAPISEFPYMEDRLKDIVNKGAKSDCVNLLLNLYYYNKDAYDYVMNSDILFRLPQKKDDYEWLQLAFFEDSRACNRFSADILSPNALKEIEKGYLNSTRRNQFLREYVDYSDDFQYNNELRVYLSKFEVEDDFEVFRGDRDVGMFKNISIENTKLAREVKKILALHYLKIKKDLIVAPNGKYDKLFDEKINLYDYIKSKKELTLSDAMLVAKYGNEKFIDNICSEIKNNAIIDNRFKSTTFSEDMANNWIAGEDFGARAISKLKIKKGCEGVYDSVANGQCEFILNKNKKEIKFDEAKYNKEKNVFELCGTVENLEK